MQLERPPAMMNSRLQRPTEDLISLVARATITKIVNTAQRMMKNIPAFFPLRKPRAAPSLWMFTSLISPGISSREPVLSAMFPATQNLVHWSRMMTSNATMAYSIIYLLSAGGRQLDWRPTGRGIREGAA